MTEWEHIGRAKVRSDAIALYGVGSFRDYQDVVNAWVQELRDDPVKTIADWHMGGGMDELRRDNLKKQAWRIGGYNLPEMGELKVVAETPSGERLHTFGTYHLLAFEDGPKGPEVEFQKDPAIKGDHILAAYVRSEEEINEGANISLPINLYFPEREKAAQTRLHLE